MAIKFQLTDKVIDPIGVDILRKTQVKSHHREVNQLYNMTK